MSDATNKVGELIREDTVTMFDEDPTEEIILNDLEFSLLEELAIRGYDVEGAMVDFAEVSIDHDNHTNDRCYLSIKLADGSRFSTEIMESDDSGYGTPAYSVEIREAS